MQWAAPFLAFLSAVAALIVVGADRAVRPSDGELTSYVGLSGTAAAVDLAAGLGLFVVAAVALWSPATARLGTLALFAGAAWFAPDVEGWGTGGTVLHSLGSAAVPLFPTVLAGLVLVASRGQIRSRIVIGGLTIGSLVIVVAAVSRSLVRDPLLDPYCWRNCLDNVVLVRAAPALARDLDRVWLAGTVGVGIALVAGCIWFVATASPAALQSLGPVLAAGALAGAAEAAYAAALLRTPLEDPRLAEFSTLYYARSLAVAALAVSLVWSVAWTWQARSSVLRVTRALSESPPPGGLRDALAEAFADPALEVAYWLPTAHGYVDGDGRTVEEPVPESGRAVTPIVRHGSPVAVVVHDAALAGDAFERELGSAALLAFDNERLQAEVRAQLENLRRSRMRITEHGDAERRRLERDLHDGAQQRLLALSYELRLARSAAIGEGADDVAVQLESAVEQAQRALEELRQLAHGIYPAILTEAGLGPALATLVDDAPIPAQLGAVPDQRCSTLAEAAAYAAVREVIDDAAARSATTLTVNVAWVDDRLELTIEDDGAPRSSELLHVQDRIGALGGRTDVGERSLHAELPCA